MDTKIMNCINCPLGCELEVIVKDDNILVSGNTCEKGKIYAINELTNPTRIVTSTMKTDKENYVSCKTDKPVSKTKIMDVISEMKKNIVKEPISINDVIIKNVCNLDVNVIATKSIK